MFAGVTGFELGRAALTRSTARCSTSCCMTCGSAPPMTKKSTSATELNASRMFQSR